MPPNASDTLRVEVDEDPPRSRHLRQRASELGGAFHRKSEPKLTEHTRQRIELGIALLR
jgi:hypothetical protein